jgi:hypothetical protein
VPGAVAVSGDEAAGVEASEVDADLAGVESVDGEVGGEGAGAGA